MAAGATQNAVSDWQNVEPNDWQDANATPAPQSSPKYSGNPYDPGNRTPTGEPLPGDPRNTVQRTLDNLITPDPQREEWQSRIKSGVDDFAQHVARNVVPLISHPIDSAEGIFKSLLHPGDTGESLGKSALEDYRAHGAIRGTTDLLGTGTGMLATGELGGETIKTLPNIGKSIRSAAIGDPDAAALRGLRVGPASPKALSTIRATQGARPFLQGADNLADLQARIPAAKNEIWGPYQKTVDAIGDKPVQGPDGPTTVRELEAERQQLSAINRQLKSRVPNPEAVKLAEQKGLNQAQMLQRERAVQNALDPVLRDAGIQPKAIRQAFGQVSQIGERVSGKSTLAESKQPYGFGKMANLSLEHPLQAPAQIFSGVRDLAAGRPWWSGSPTDVSLREAFRPQAAKPDFGAFKPGPPPIQPKMLEANTIGNAPYGDEPYAGSMNGIREINPTRITPPPEQPRGFLPSKASAGEPLPMIRYAPPYQEPFDPHFRPADLNEYKNQLRKMKEKP